MPIYQYRCQECGSSQELLLKVDEELIEPCEKCQKHTLVKCVSAPRVRFKGQGYYETDEKAKSKQRNIASSANEGETKTEATCQKTACDHSSH